MVDWESAVDLEAVAEYSEWVSYTFAKENKEPKGKKEYKNKSNQIKKKDKKQKINNTFTHKKAVSH